MVVVAFKLAHLNRAHHGSPLKVVEECLPWMIHYHIGFQFVAVNNGIVHVGCRLCIQ